MEMEVKPTPPTRIDLRIYYETKNDKFIIINLVPNLRLTCRPVHAFRFAQDTMAIAHSQSSFEKLYVFAFTVYCVLNFLSLTHVYGKGKQNEIFVYLL